LIHELEQIKPAEAPEPPAADWFISVSIDVAGSTEAKTREPNRKLDHRATEVFLRAFYAAFLKCELEFYDCLTNSNDNFEPLALSTIFYVKGIGDEVWLLIKPAVANDDHLRHLFVKIVAAALVLASKPISLREAADLPLKIFADKVDGAYSISEQRAEMIKNWLQKMEQENRLEASSFAIIANRLGAGTSTVSAGTWRNAYRTDYIGHDIDRLFRAAKTARPLIVTVGQNFMHAVDPEVAQLPQDHNYHRSVLARIDPLNPNAQRSTSFHLRPECIPARDMKGIEYDYRVYHIHDPAVLRRMVGIPVTRLIQPGFRPVHAERVELRQLMQKSFLGRQRRPFCRRSEELAGEAEDSSPSGSVADP
jgi:hypothetical protein